MSRDYGGAAFPQPQPYVDGNGNWHYSHEPGMTRRDWFAGQVAAGDAANPDSGVWSNSASDEALLYRAKLYYRIADAMVEASK